MAFALVLSRAHRTLLLHQPGSATLCAAVLKTVSYLCARLVATVYRIDKKSSTRGTKTSRDGGSLMDFPTVDTLCLLHFMLIKLDVRNVGIKWQLAACR